MKKIIFPIILASLSFLSYAQSNGRTRAEETINPELDNLSGVRPEIDELDPENAGSIGFDEIEGGIDQTNGNETSELTQDSRNVYEHEVVLLSSAIEIYPNPSTSYIIVRLDNNYSGLISIVNLLGQPVVQVEINGKENYIELNDLDQGIYFISIESGTTKIVKKIKVVK